MQSTPIVKSIVYGNNYIPNISVCGNITNNCSQIWMIKDLDVSAYRDGTTIPEVKDSATWSNLTTGAWCWYGNDSASNAGVYGKLYNFYAVSDTIHGGLAPNGWHVPSSNEWNAYISCLGGVYIAGDKLREVGISHWYSPNATATNSSGFTALGNGLRYPSGFGGKPIAGYWWSTTQIQNNVLVYILDSRVSYITENTYSKNFGYSVRCLKD